VITLVSLLFITMIPIDCKITNFLYACLFAFFWEITIIISWHAPNKLLVENLLARTFRIHSFSAYYAVLQKEDNMKSISTTNPAITENTECMIVKARASVIDIKNGYVCCLNMVYHYASFCFQLFNVWLLFQAKNNVRSAPASTALT